MRGDLGVMISASHNPFEDNGIKLFDPDGYKLSNELEARIEALLDNEVAPVLAGPRDIGRAERIDFTARYVESATRTLGQRGSLKGIRVVIDCANGAAYKVAPQALRELGAEVTEIGVEPNGFNINSNVGSTAPEALARKVREMRADAGIALDGDADRMVLVDEKGNVVDGDQVMAVLAESWRNEGRLTKPGIVATIMSNLGLERHLAGLGLALERTPVGDRHDASGYRQADELGGPRNDHDALLVSVQVSALRQTQQAWPSGASARTAISVLPLSARRSGSHTQDHSRQRLVSRSKAIHNSTQLKDHESCKNGKSFWRFCTGIRE
jgi:phosphoglucosamine mutase